MQIQTGIAAYSNIWHRYRCYRYTMQTRSRQQLVDPTEPSETETPCLLSGSGSEGAPCRRLSQ